MEDRDYTITTRPRYDSEHMNLMVQSRRKNAESERIPRAKQRPIMARKKTKMASNSLMRHVRNHSGHCKE